MRILISLVFGVISVSTAAADEAGPFHFEFEEVADDVWVGVRPDSPRFPVMGNATFVISDAGVVVFDGGGQAAMSEQLIGKIRSLTDKPVTHVVISHWHGDHNFGVYRFAEEFPGVQFVTHEFTNEVFHSTRIHYIDRQRGFVENNLEEFQKIADTGIDSEGNEHNDADRKDYRRIIEDAETIHTEFNRARVTPADITFTDKYTIQSGDRTIELLHLGHANTAGDIVMWLPDDRIVATGDIVVHPSPYSFNVPPRAWAQTMRNINALDYAVLVPGHGEIQRDTAYVDLNIEAAESIADQRDSMLAEGKSTEEVQEALDFSAFEARFTNGDEYVKSYYDAYFETPFRAAAMKALTGEPMVQIEPPEEIPFNDERWQIEAVDYELVEHLGQPALRIKGGAAMLPDLDVANGLVEFDMAITAERGFAGLRFRSRDGGNFEHFYIRPHQSGQPDANQYTPVFNGNSAWQLYHGEGYGAPVTYRYNEWMHVKILYAGDNALVFIDSDEPALTVTDLKHGTVSGAIGLDSANFSAVHFANFKYTKLADAYAFSKRPDVNADTTPDLVAEWQVSDAFAADELKGRTELTADDMSARKWSALAAENSGITNLSQLQPISDGNNTVFARFSVDSDATGIREMSLGYSDAASVYVNGTLIYRGDNTYQSRDYRYLGTIGLFDKVALPLQEGDNEICIAVTEAFGGWGVIASLAEE